MAGVGGDTKGAKRRKVASVGAMDAVQRHAAQFTSIDGKAADWREKHPELFADGVSFVKLEPYIVTTVDVDFEANDLIRESLTSFLADWKDSEFRKTHGRAMRKVCAETDAGGRYNCQFSCLPV